MSPPDSDPAILAQRRARRAEIAEEQLQDQLAHARREIDRLQGRADALSGELEIARDRRDQMAGEIDGLNRDLRYSHQREHSERQLRIETQDDLAQARRDATGAHEELRAQLREAHQRAEEFERELSQRRRDADHALGLIERHEAARAKAEAAAHGADEMRAELDRRDALQTEFAEKLQALRDELDALRERHDTDAARQTIAQQALHDVMAAAARMRERLEQAQLLRAEAQERLTLTREQLDERDEQLAHATRELNEATVTVASLRAQLHSERERAASTHSTAVRIQLGDHTAIYDEIRQLAGMVADVVALAAAVRSSYEHETDRVQAHLDAERDRHDADRARLQDEVRRRAPAVSEWPVTVAVPPADAEPEPAAALEPEPLAAAELESEPQPAQLPAPAPAPAETVIADLSAAAQRLRSAAEVPADEPGPEAQEPAEADDADWRVFSVRGGPAQPIGSWLTPALAALGEADDQAATEILVALLALQGRTNQTLLYELTIPWSGMWRVSIHHGIADIIRDARRSYDGSAAFHVAGGPQDLAVLAGGGKGKLGGGAKVTGKRRRLRKLLRAGREPVGLADAALLLHPGQALALLTAAPMGPPPRGEPLAVELHTRSDIWHVIADSHGVRAGSGPLPSDGPAVQATLKGSPTDIVGLLGGASSLGIRVNGDAASARAMMDLMAAIQAL